MSATNRGAERMAEDAYPTPKWCVRRFFDGLNEMGVKLPRGEWVEPCVGEGAIVQVVNELAPPERWTLVDVRDTREHPNLFNVAGTHFLGDYLTLDLPRVSVVITNPPYALAESIIKKALTHADWVAMLLRLNFKGSDERNEWLRSDMPDELALPNRPQFIASYKCEPRDEHDRGCGWAQKLPIDAPKIKVCPVCGRKVSRVSSDSAEYGWLLWGPERGRRVGRSIILPTTPPEERGVKVRGKKNAAGEGAPATTRAQSDLPGTAPA